jgi:purine nucleosidase
MTVVDLRAPAPAECTTQYAADLDVPGFWALVVDAVSRIGDPEV